MKKWILSLIALALLAGPAFGQYGRRYYNFEVVDEFGVPHPTASNLTITVKNSSDSDVSSACYTTSAGSTAFDTTPAAATFAFWSAEATINVQVVSASPVLTIQKNGLAVGDHRIMMSTYTFVTGAGFTCAALTATSGTFTGTQTYGVDATGVDVQWYGDTTVNSMLWDYTDDRLELTHADILFDDDSDLIIGSGSDFVIDSDTAKTLDILPAGADDLYVVNVGLDQSGVHFKLFGASASNYALWDATDDRLELVSADILFDDNSYLLIGAGSDMTFISDGTDVTIAGSGAISIENSSLTIGNAATDGLTLTAAIQGANSLVLDGATDDTNTCTITSPDYAAAVTMTLPDDTGNFMYTPGGKTTMAAGNGAIPITHGIVEATSGAASAWTLADGKTGQVLTIAIVTDGGEATVTPDTTFTGWATAVFTDDIDTLTLLFVDGTAGWVVIGNAGDGTNLVALTQ